MFNSTALEVGIGLMFVYLLAALAVTAASEVVAGVLRLRAATLKEGLKELLGDPAWFDKVMKHPLVAALHQTKSEGPSYISSAVFARALTDAVFRSQTNPPLPGTGGVAGAFSIEQFEQTVKALASAGLKQALQALAAEARNDVRDAVTQATKVQDQIEVWFNEAMDRVSGWYKRRAQIIVLIIAAVITTALNIDSMNIARALSRSPELRSTVVKAAEKRVALPAPATQPAAKKDSTTVAEIGADYARFDEQMAALQATDLPLGWESRPCDSTGPTPLLLELRYPPNTAGGWAEKFFGLLVTTLAVSLGAPFWFDILSKVVSIRSAGKAPEEDPKRPKKEPTAKGPLDTPPGQKTG
jgi:hypothetical protein